MGRAGRVLISAFAFLCMPTFLGAQALNEAFLRSTVLISFEPAPNTKTSGTGFFLFRPLTGDQGHVLLTERCERS